VGILKVIELDPSDPLEIAFQLTKAVKRSGLSREDILARLRQKYGYEVSYSGLSQLLRRGTIGLQRALQLLDVLGESEIRIRHIPK